MAEAHEDPEGPAVPAVPYADPLGDPLLRTRFAPARPATFLRRQRLVDHLGQALRTPLTLLNGVAGAGKTLLAADRAARLPGPVAPPTRVHGGPREAARARAASQEREGNHAETAAWARGVRQRAKTAANLRPSTTG
ncbi:hypothetical protein GCM10010353_64630 [Streptomyces chryseus]|nr:hypothetical protein GCM10010353_64630 [Streptomyces chryseus]